MSTRSIDLSTIESAFFLNNTNSFTQHKVIIRKGNSITTTDKQNLKQELNGKCKKISLANILTSLSHEASNDKIKESELEKMFSLSRYFIQKATPSGNPLITKIKTILSRFRNLFSGYKFKSDQQYAKELEATLRAKIVSKLGRINKGTKFVPQDFWDSMGSHRPKTDQKLYTDPDMTIALKNFNSFCKKVAEDKSEVNISQSLLKPFSITPTIHFIWLGSAVPDKVKVVIDSWRQHNPGFDIKIWTDQEVKNYPLVNREAFEATDVWAEKADILRYEILYNEGGIYSDTDVICYGSFKDLISHNINCFAGQESNQEYRWLGYEGKCLLLCNAVLGAAKGSPVMKYCIDNLTSKSKAPNTHISVRTGPIHLSRAFSNAFNTPQSENYLVLPCSYFYPLPFHPDLKKKKLTDAELATYVDPESLAVHLWDGSWVK